MQTLYLPDGNVVRFRISRTEAQDLVRVRTPEQPMPVRKAFGHLVSE